MNLPDESEKKIHQWVVAPEDDGIRLDHFLQKQEIETTRSQLKQHIEEGFVLINDTKAIKPSKKLKPGQKIILQLRPPRALNASAQELPLDVRYEDEHLLIINKPRNMVVHPAPGHYDGTLVNALVYHFSLKAGDPARPGLVHRLDKDTSGLMVIARTEEALNRLVLQFQDHSITRKYKALVSGNPPDQIRLETLHGRHPTNRKRFSTKVTKGKSAISEISTVSRFFNAALIEVTLFTGRTHQVRVHCFENGFPILGDPLYTPKHLKPEMRIIHESLAGQALHAFYLGFEHPVYKTKMEFQSDPPEIFLEKIEILKNLQQD